MPGMVEYRNPIIPGFNPNPSCVLVDGTYYLVTASYLYWPGIPVYTSRDLVNWTHVGTVCTRASQVDLTPCVSRVGASQSGLSAATIRYKDGTFYVLATLAYSDRILKYRNLLFTCHDPVKEEWSDPIVLDFTGSAVSLFIDDDRRAYVQGVVSARGRTEIQQLEMDLKTGQSLSGAPKSIWKDESGQTLHGPRSYKKDEFYYLLFSEGNGTSDQTFIIARSRSVSGPFERSPDSLLASSPTGDLQPAGHMDLVRSPQGQWFAVCSAIRNGGEEPSSLGAEVCLVPLEWDSDGWPKVTTKEGGIPTRATAPLPSPTPAEEQPSPKPIDILALCTDSFPLSLPLGLVTLRNPPSPLPYRLLPSSHHLALISSYTALPSADDSPRMILRRLTSPRSTWRFTLGFQQPAGPAYDVGPVFEAGIVLYKDHAHHFDFAVSRNLVWTGQSRVRTLGDGPARVSGQRTVDMPARLRIETFQEGRYEFWAMCKDEWVLIHADEEGKAVSGGMAGVMIGPYIMSQLPVAMYVQEWTVEDLQEDAPSDA